jgi:putative thioredoxin
MHASFVDSRGLSMAAAISVDRTNFDQVVLEGSRERPVLVDFWAPWCGPCRTLAPMLDKLAAEYADRFTLAKLDTDRDPEIAGRYGVRGIPNCKLFVDGQVADEFTGVLPESALRQFLERALPSPAAALIEAAKSRLLEDDANGAMALLDEAIAIDPEDEDAALTRMEALLACGRSIEAGQVAFALESPQRARTRPLRDELRLATLKARVALAAGGNQDLAALEARAASSSDTKAKLDYANALAASGDYKRALDELLAIVNDDRSYADDSARKAMLTIFEALGADSDLARSYRRELAAAINR